MNKFLLVILVMFASCEPNKKENADQQASVAGGEEQRLKELAGKFPDSLILKENLIQYYRENGNYETALLEVNRALEKDSMNARLWDIKAILHFEDADTLSSITAFEKALAIVPNPADLISLGTLYAQTGNKKALELAGYLLSRHKADTEKEALFIKGLYFAFTNDNMQAVDYFDQCIALNFTFMDAYREKAIALYNMAKYGEALSVLDKAITLQNNFDEGYYYMGKCYEKLNRKQDAIESYQTALLYSPDYTEAKDALARLGVKY